MMLREVQPQDNQALEQIIKAIFPEFNMPLTGTAYEDIETLSMFESYQKSREVYYVIEEDGRVVGGGGIKSLNGYENDICELQKVYLTPTCRGKGYGKLIFNKCISAARDYGYKQCYLESASQMTTAIDIYEKAGFKHLKESFGNTGHYSCGVWMMKDI